MTEPSKLKALDSTHWKGHGELWLDPTGDQAIRYPCTASLQGTSLQYEWSNEGQAHQGTILWSATGGTFQDTFHQASTTPCKAVTPTKAEVDLRYDYPAGEGPAWGWRIILAVRPSDELVLQMINIAPWGEQSRAVRMLFERTTIQNSP